MYDFDAEIHSMDITDGRTNKTVTLFYDPPSNNHILRWQEFINRGKKNKKGVLDQAVFAKACFKFGAEILSGFKTGYFVKGGVFISTDPDDKDYYPGWKELVLKRRGDLVMHLGMQIFGLTRQKDLLEEQENGEADDNSVEGIDIDAMFEDDGQAEQQPEEPQPKAEAQPERPLQAVSST